MDYNERIEDIWDSLERNSRDRYDSSVAYKDFVLGLIGAGKEAELVYKGLLQILPQELTIQEIVNPQTPEQEARVEEAILEAGNAAATEQNELLEKAKQMEKDNG